jgi:hypothetical protein
LSDFAHATQTVSHVVSQQKPSTQLTVHARHPATRQSAPFATLQIAACAFCGIQVAFAAQ